MTAAGLVARDALLRLLIVAARDLASHRGGAGVRQLACADPALTPQWACHKGENECDGKQACHDQIWGERMLDGEGATSSSIRFGWEWCNQTFLKYRVGGTSGIPGERLFLISAKGRPNLTSLRLSGTKLIDAGPVRVGEFFGCRAASRMAVFMRVASSSETRQKASSFS